MVIKNVNRILFLILLFSIISYSGNSSALPSYKRLWEKKYGYTTSCTLCHSKGGGSQLNSYGEDFQRFGMSPGAFVIIEKRDSDKDSFTNIAEITAKSNPGEFSSNPKNTTDWLSRIEESLLPLNELKKIFPGMEKFSVLEGTLFPEQIKDIESKLDKKLSESDAVPTFYFSIKDDSGSATRIGVAIFSSPSANSEKLIAGVGVDLSGKIKNVVLIKNKLNKDLSNQKFLDQFKDKTYDSALQINKDIQPAGKALVAESDQVTEAVRKSLLIIRIVFNKNKKASTQEQDYDYAVFKTGCSNIIECHVDKFLSPRP